MGKFETFEFELRIAWMDSASSSFELLAIYYKTLSCEQ